MYSNLFSYFRTLTQRLKQKGIKKREPKKEKKQRKEIELQKKKKGTAELLRKRNSKKQTRAANLKSKRKKINWYIVKVMELWTTLWLNLEEGTFGLKRLKLEKTKNKRRTMW